MQHLNRSIFSRRNSPPLSRLKQWRRHHPMDQVITRDTTTTTKWCTPFWHHISNAICITSPQLEENTLFLLFLARPFCSELLFIFTITQRPCMCTHTHATLVFLRLRRSDQSTFLCKEIRIWLFLSISARSSNGKLETNFAFPSGPNLAEPINLDINPDLTNMINSDSHHQPVYQPAKPVAAAPIKTFDPSKGWIGVEITLEIVILSVLVINDKVEVVTSVKSS